MLETPIHILLVEDNDADAAMLECELEDSPFGPFKMTRRESLRDAVLELSRQNFDVALLDLGLGDSQGLATLEKFRSHVSPDTPVVVLTGVDDEGQGVRALQHGAEDYLVKNGPRDSLRSIRYAIERRRISDSLKLKEHQLAIAVDAAELGLFSWDLKSRRISWSYHYARLLGITPADEMVETLDALLRCVHAEDQPGFITALERAIANDEPYEHQYRVVWPDRSEHWIEARGKVFKDQNQQPVRLIGTVMDISHRKRAEEIEKKREQELSRLADAHLTPRELSLLKMVVAGMPNKRIAMNLKISIRTVAKHRAHLMTKTQAINAADLARMTTLAGILPQ
jgi:PAS domain S-box-containing protein